MGQNLWVFPTCPFLLHVHLAFEEQSTGLTHWLLSWLPLGLFFSPLHITSYKKLHQKCPLTFLSIHFFCRGAVGSFSGCLSNNNWGRTTPTQQSRVISFCPHNTAVMQELAPSIEVGNGAQGSGHFLKVIQLSGGSGTEVRVSLISPS